MPRPRRQSDTPPSRVGPREFSVRLDAELLGVLRRLPNRSAFLRRAILAALSQELPCPLCQGGRLRPEAGWHLFRLLSSACPAPPPPVPIPD